MWLEVLEWSEANNQLALQGCVISSSSIRCCMNGSVVTALNNSASFGGKGARCCYLLAEFVRYWLENLASGAWLGGGCKYPARGIIGKARRG